MKNYKNLFFLLGLALLVSCGNSGSTGDQPAMAANMPVSGTASGAPVHLTKQAFLEKVFNYETQQEWKYQGDVPCIIDFYADWCKPCKMIAPYMEEFAKKYEGKIHIYKINTDKEKELAGAFQISSIPAVLFIPMEGQPQMSVGALSKDDYEKAIREVLLKETESDNIQ